MGCFLWVEDFEGGSYKTTTDFVFGETLNSPIPEEQEELRKYLDQHNITVKFDFLDALNFISNSQNLAQIDCIILDIDLPVKTPETNDENKRLPEILKLYGYQSSQNEEDDEESWTSAQQKLKQEAGYQLYVELIFRQGFPKDHIFICSNHGENLNSILDAFDQAKIERPEIVGKSNPKCTNWVAQWRDRPYHNLRRGIIEGCQYLKKELSRHPLQFSKFFDPKQGIDPSIIEDYLETLERFLPLREPQSKERQHQLKLFARTLAHLWEDKTSPQSLKNHEEYHDWNQERSILETFGWIMKSTRNLMTHTSFLDDLDEQDIAFFFLINMRAMFELGNGLQQYEKELLKLFSQSELPKKFLLESALNNSYRNIKNDSDSVHFSKLVMDRANSSKKLDKKRPFVQLIYQIFWHNLHKVKWPRMNQNKSLTEEKLSFHMNSPLFHPPESSYYLIDFACHFFDKSFGNGTKQKS